MLRRLRCLIRGFHLPERNPVGGFRCADCGKPMEHMGDGGTLSFGYISTRALVSLHSGKLREVAQ